MAPWETNQFPFFMTKGYQRDLRVTGFVKFLSLRSLKTSILNRNTNCEMDLDSIVSMFQYQMSIITKHFKPQMWIFWSDKQHLGLQIQRLLHKCIQTQQQDQKCSVEVPPHHPNSHHWWLPWKVLTYLSKTTYQRSKTKIELKIQGGGDSLSLCMRKGFMRQATPAGFLDFRAVKRSEVIPKESFGGKLAQVQ